ncbi:hypothetical protein [Amycolatopsis pigmentata]|uniref:XRE family transcriptional regulator n=1 Tax=Amycolatopsis pigmentata TaxID=450801 RepID=A0ABW5FNH3_9PSEU
MDPEDGALQRLAADLRCLRERAGNPGYRELARRAHYSSTTLSIAAGGGKWECPNPNAWGGGGGM